MVELPAASSTFQVTVDRPLLNTKPASVVEPLPVDAPLTVYVVAVIPQLSPVAVGLNSVVTAV